jgi:hypothetical protein
MKSDKSLMVTAHQQLGRISAEDRATLEALAKKHVVSMAWVLRKALSEYAVRIRKGNP